MLYWITVSLTRDGGGCDGGSVIQGLPRPLSQWAGFIIIYSHNTEILAVVISFWSNMVRYLAHSLTLCIGTSVLSEILY